MKRRHGLIVNVKGQSRIFNRRLARMKALSAASCVSVTPSEAVTEGSERDKLELSDLRYKVKAFTKEYESVCNSKSWLYTAPIRKLLDKVIKIKQKAGLLSASITQVFADVANFTGLSFTDWVAVANRFKGDIAIVQAVVEDSGHDPEYPVQLASFFVDNGYLVLFVYMLGSSSGRIDNPDLRRSGIIPVPLDEFVANAKRIHPIRNNSHVCWITAPCSSFLKQLPSLRAVGFSLILAIKQDLEAVDFDWYEEDYEEQATLFADLVVVASAALKQKFSHLRGDIVCLDDLCQASANDLSHLKQVLDRATNKLSMRDIYA